MNPPIPEEQDMSQQGMGGDMIPQDDGMEMQTMDNGQSEQSQFDTNFDPGVEADEETDPKRFIQQLAGKLSQSLRKYNDDNGQPDIDLDKYVAGMIVSQAIKGLSQDDADEILDKIKSGDNFSDEAPDQNQQNDEQMPIDNGNMNQNGNMPIQDINMPQQPNESAIRNGDNIEEIVNGVLQDANKDRKTYQQFSINNRGFRKKPFTSPNFN